MEGIRAHTPTTAPDVLDPVPTPMAMTAGPDHVLTYVNRACREALGNVLGMPSRAAFSGFLRPEDLDLFDRVRATGEPATTVAAPVPAGPHRDGTQRYFNLCLSSVPLQDGGRGVLVVVMEVTEHVAAAEQVRALSDARRRALQRYRSLVTTSARMVWVTDHRGRILEGGRAWMRVTGQAREQLRGDGWLNCLHPDDRERVAEAWSRAVDEAPDLFTCGYRLRHADGTYRHYDVRAVPIREDGAVVEWVGAATDVEESWQRSRRDEFLARAAAAVAEAENVRDALATLSRMIVPALADSCGIYLVPGEAGEDIDAGASFVAERIAATADDGMPQNLPPLGEEYIAPASPIARAVRGRHPVHATFAPGAIPAAVAPPGTLPWLTLAGAHSMVLVPVLVDGAVVAVASAFVCGERDAIGPEDMDLMRELLTQAHDPLSNVLRFQRTQRVALALQHSLLSDPPRVPGLEMTARYVPSRTAAEVGGDWYDSFVLADGSVALVIGDVAGHDLDAAVTMSRMRNMLRGIAVDRQEGTGAVIRRLDTAAQLLDPDGATVTCVYCRAARAGEGSWHLRYSVAGHPPPLLITPRNGARFLTEAQSPLLGLPVPVPERSGAAEPLPPGSTLVLYTDGLVEQPREEIGRGLERLRLQAEGAAAEPLDAFCDLLLGRPGADGRDDIALIALRVPDRTG
ncbi:SpoIIE family protein phosphatase [Streptomyces meridianus]|uniref:SpoIIE family protein phosphatase n=1 Tax=Streptomyces meridianus TaxID=2938945 RepID=A0ABT0XBT7_9ACTN|nr:SpoIIE family protein phosphatase [Streptomyces meridianus]MCM2579982.1 SpoIIE family protein phosphatase [Streptomyces meridianus]